MKEREREKEIDTRYEKANLSCDERGSKNRVWVTMAEKDLSDARVGIRTYIRTYAGFKGGKNGSVGRSVGDDRSAVFCIILVSFPSFGVISSHGKKNKINFHSSREIPPQNQFGNSNLGGNFWSFLTAALSCRGCETHFVLVVVIVVLSGMFSIFSTQLPRLHDGR